MATYLYSSPPPPLCNDTSNSTLPPSPPPPCACTKTTPPLPPQPLPSPPPPPPPPSPPPTLHSPPPPPSPPHFPPLHSPPPPSPYPPSHPPKPPLPSPPPPTPPPRKTPPPHFSPPPFSPPPAISPAPSPCPCVCPCPWGPPPNPYNPISPISPNAIAPSPHFPPSDNGHHRTVYLTTFVSLGGAFFFLFITVGLLSMAMKKLKSPMTSSSQSGPAGSTSNEGQIQYAQSNTASTDSHVVDIGNTDAQAGDVAKPGVAEAAAEAGVSQNPDMKQEGTKDQQKPPLKKQSVKEYSSVPPDVEKEFNEDGEKFNESNDKPLEEKNVPNNTDVPQDDSPANEEKIDEQNLKSPTDNTDVAENADGQHDGEEGEQKNSKSQGNESEIDNNQDTKEDSIKEKEDSNDPKRKKLPKNPLSGRRKKKSSASTSAKDKSSALLRVVNVASKVVQDKEEEDEEALASESEEDAKESDKHQYESKEEESDKQHDKVVSNQSDQTDNVPVAENAEQKSRETLEEKSNASKRRQPTNKKNSSSSTSGIGKSPLLFQALNAASEVDNDEEEEEVPKSESQEDAKEMKLDGGSNSANEEESDSVTSNQSDQTDKVPVAENVEQKSYTTLEERSNASKRRQHTSKKKFSASTTVKGKTSLLSWGLNAASEVDNEGEQEEVPESESQEDAKELKLGGGSNSANEEVHQHQSDATEEESGKQNDNVVSNQSDQTDKVPIAENVEQKSNKTFEERSNASKRRQHTNKKNSLASTTGKGKTSLLSWGMNAASEVDNDEEQGVLESESQEYAKELQSGGGSNSANEEVHRHQSDANEEESDNVTTNQSDQIDKVPVAENVEQKSYTTLEGRSNASKRRQHTSKKNSSASTTGKGKTSLLSWGLNAASEVDNDEEKEEVPESESQEDAKELKLRGGSNSANEEVHQHQSDATEEELGEQNDNVVSNQSDQTDNVPVAENAEQKSRETLEEKPNVSKRRQSTSKKNSSSSTSGKGNSSLLFQGLNAASEVDNDEEKEEVPESESQEDAKELKLAGGSNSANEEVHHHQFDANEEESDNFVVSKQTDQTENVHVAENAEQKSNASLAERSSVSKRRQQTSKKNDPASTSGKGKSSILFQGLNFASQSESESHGGAKELKLSDGSNNADEEETYEIENIYVSEVLKRENSGVEEGTKKLKERLRPAKKNSLDRSSGNQQPLKLGPVLNTASQANLAKEVVKSQDDDNGEEMHNLGPEDGDEELKPRRSANDEDEDEEVQHQFAADEGGSFEHHDEALSNQSETQNMDVTDQDVKQESDMVDDTLNVPKKKSLPHRKSGVQRKKESPSPAKILKATIGGESGAAMTDLADYNEEIEETIDQSVESESQIVSESGEEETEPSTYDDQSVSLTSIDDPNLLLKSHNEEEPADSSKVARRRKPQSRPQRAGVKYERRA